MVDSMVLLINDQIGEEILHLNKLDLLPMFMTMQVQFTNTILPFGKSMVKMLNMECVRPLLLCMLEWQAHPPLNLGGHLIMVKMWTINLGMPTMVRVVEIE